MQVVEKTEVLELVKRARERDSAAIENLIERYKLMIHKINSNWGNAEDGFQEGILGLYEAVEKYDSTKGTKFSSFLYLILRKKIRRYYIKECTYIVTPDVNEITFDPEIEKVIDNKALCKKLLKSLTPKERALLYLHYKEGYNLTEIAQMWKVSKQHISNYKLNILRKLRNKL